MSDDPSLAKGAPIPAPRRAVWARALGLLGARDLSCDELSQRLREKGFDDDAVAWALARLRAEGLVDDARFAEGVARQKLAHQARAKRAVTAALTRRGVDPSVAAAAVAEAQAEAGVDEKQNAVRAAEKKLRSLRAEPPEQQKKKLWAYLARQGFDFDAVRHAVAAVLSAADADDGSDPEP